MFSVTGGQDCAALHCKRMYNTCKADITVRQIMPVYENVQIWPQLAFTGYIFKNVL